MNYNNFSCRLAAPRPSPTASVEMPRKAPAKKERKRVRTRLATAVSVLSLLFGLLSIEASATPAAHSTSPTFRLVPAAETESFTGFSGHLAIDLTSASEDSDRNNENAREGDNDLAAQLDALTEQMRALAAQPLPGMNPSHPARLSILTAVLLCAGLAVAIARTTLLFRHDFVC